MDIKNPQYNRFALVREMLETPGVIENFDFSQGAQAQASIKNRGKVFFTGEGSSRIFPAKHFIWQNLLQGAGLAISTEGSRQAAECTLEGYSVFGASNSGKTKEVVTLFRNLKAAGKNDLFSLSAFDGTPLGDAADAAYVLSCGKEDAVAATKSVVEQGLFYHMLLDRLTGAGKLAAQAGALAEATQKALTLEVDPKIAQALAGANILHWAGRNNGVAEELTLKTNEITRKRSAYLEGTYAVHGIEEVMSEKDAVIVVDPFEAEEDKFEEVLVKGVGCTVIALAARPTRFPTVILPTLEGLDGYIQLTAGWNLLVEIAMALKIDMDNPTRARKVGNELVETPAS